MKADLRAISRPLRESVLERFTMDGENPFSPTFPVNPKYFVNRTNVIDSLKRAFQRSVK